MYFPTDRPPAWSRARGLGQTSTSQIQAWITQYANQYGVNPALALAIAQQESGFNASAVSATNSNGTTDYGVMQINSSNLASLGLTPTTALNPQQNIQAAMQLLSTYTQQYGGDPAQIAAAYNGGPGASQNTGTTYVSSVLANMANFGGSTSDTSSSLSDIVSSLTGGDTDLSDSSGGIDPNWIYVGLIALGGLFVVEMA